MKIKDMEKAMADGTPVATKYNVVPVTIVELRCERRVFSGARWDFNGHFAYDGVRVRYADGEEDVHGTREDGREKVIGPRDVLGAFEEVSAQRESERQVRTDRESALEAERVRCEQAVVRFGVGRVIERRSFGYGTQLSRLLGYEVALTAEQAEGLERTRLSGS